MRGISRLWSAAARTLRGRGVFVVALVAVPVLVVGLMAPAASAAGDGSSGSVPPSQGGVGALNDIQSFTTIFRTNVAFAGLGGLRGGSGSGTIALSGVAGPVTRAFLYWHGPTDSSDPAVNADVTFAGQGVTGTNIGLSSDNCWGFQNSQAYRADVTALVSGNGNYSVGNLIKASADINGVELVVFYDGGNPAAYQDVVMFDGNDSNQPNPFDANGWNVTLPGINYASGPASIEMIVSDGQTFPEDGLTLNSQTLVAPGNIFDGATVPDAGTAGSTSGGLWDQRNFDITSFLTPGPNTLTLTSGQGNDCLSLIATDVILPAGSAPNQPPLITVTKQVEGTAPTGTVFVADVVCTPVTGGQPTTHTVQFDATGTPAGDNAVQGIAGASCRVTEESLSGAAAPISVSYSCTPATGQPSSTCASDDQGATVSAGANATGALASVQIVNSYTAAPEPVLIQPRFTG